MTVNQFPITELNTLKADHNTHCDAFISYSRKDQKIGLQIYEALSRQSCKLWMDWKDIPVGTLFWERIQRGILGSNNFLFLASDNSLSSPICQLELDYALSHNKRIICVIIQEPNEKKHLYGLLKRH